jgi:hypothetical protein
VGGKPLVQEEKPAVQSNGTNITPAVQQLKPAAAEANERKVMPAEEKPAPLQTNGKDTAASTGAAPEILPPEIFERMSGELAEVAGVMSPLATLIVREHVEGLGESVQKFPKTRFSELLDSLSKELLDEKRQIDFRKRLGQSIGRLIAAQHS